jgi:hypothetical protein
MFLRLRNVCLLAIPVEPLVLLRNLAHDENGILRPVANGTRHFFCPFFIHSVTLLITFL